MTPPRYLLEIAVGTPDEARRAAKGGADRLELSSGLELGGLTPSLGLFRAVRACVEIPVYVLLRPRAGGFHYLPGELAAIRADAELFLAEGADGIVLGILDESDTIDGARCRELVELAEGKAVFHRAFDFLADPLGALDALVALGFERVLTSGSPSTAQADAKQLAALVLYAAGRIEVLPAGGIRPGNVADLVRASGCTQVHSSARGPGRFAVPGANPRLVTAMGTVDETSPAVVRGLRLELDRLAASLL